MKEKIVRDNKEFFYCAQISLNFFSSLGIHFNSTFKITAHSSTWGVSHFSFFICNVYVYVEYKNACLTHRNKVASWVCCANHHGRWVAKHLTISSGRYEISEDDDKSQHHLDTEAFPCWYCGWVGNCGLEVALKARKWDSEIEKFTWEIVA